MTYWTSLLALISFTTVCSAKDFEPFEGFKPVAVLVQEYTGAAVMGAETPRVAIYENGGVIYFRGDSAHNQGAYFYAELGFPALSTVISQLKTVTDLKGLKSSYSVTNGTDQGRALFYLRADNAEVVTSVYGLRPQDKDTKELPAGRIPNELRQLYHYLVTADFTESRPWRPAYVEAMIWPLDDAFDGLIHWPKTWPDLNSDRAIKRKNGFSIFLDGSMRDDLKNFLAGEKEKGAVEIDGRKWTVASRPVFPSEPVWRKAFSRIESN